MEQVLVEWFKQVRNKNVPVSGDLFKEKAIEIAERLGIVDFNASDGWLQKCKHRFGIQFKTEQGEAGAVDVMSLVEWQQQVLLDDLAKFDPNDVFNADETGLFWQLLPNKTMAFKGDKCAGGKKSKERITVLVGANMSGTEKLPLLVIGKSTKPRCFKKARIPVEYKANKKAWMTGDLFETWLKDFDKQMKKEDRHILLYLDNCSSHNAKAVLSNVTVKFLLELLEIEEPADQAMRNLIEVWNELHLAGEADDVALEDYVDVDEALITGGALSLNEILEKFGPDEELNEADESEVEEIAEETPISSLEAQHAWRTVRQYLETNFNDPATLHHSYAIDDALYEDRRKKQKQSRITNYFMLIP